jgi:hypothetical protein
MTTSHQHKEQATTRTTATTTKAAAEVESRAAALTTLAALKTLGVSEEDAKNWIYNPQTMAFTKPVNAGSPIVPEQNKK